MRVMYGITEIPTDLNRYAVVMRGDAPVADVAEWIVRDVLDPDSDANHERALQRQGSASGSFISHQRLRTSVST